MLANHHAPASNDSPQGDSDYDIILTALTETARGRAFLHEHARRSRATETATLLTAIGRIEDLLTSKGLEPAAPSPAAEIAPADVSEADGETIAAVEPMATEAIATDVEAAAIVSIEAVSTDIILVEAIPVEAVAAESGEREAATPETPALQTTAIEFLGPDLTGATAAVQTRTIPLSVRPKRAPRDPFADIRALSDEEKIALFA